MDTTPTRASRGPREPAAQVRRLESQAVLVPKSASPTSPGRVTARQTVDLSRLAEDVATDASAKKRSETSPSLHGTGTKSFELMRATVAEDRRREHRTPSTAPAPKVATLRKAHYLKSKSSRMASIAPTRARTNHFYEFWTQFAIYSPH